MKRPFFGGMKEAALSLLYPQLLIVLFMLTKKNLGVKGLCDILVVCVVWDIFVLFIYFLEGEYIFDETGFVKKNLYYKKRISYNEFKTIQYIALPAMSEGNYYRLGYDIVNLVFADIPLELKYDVDYIRKFKKAKKIEIFILYDVNLYNYLLEHLDKEKADILRKSHEMHKSLIEVADIYQTKEEIKNEIKNKQINDFKNDQTVIKKQYNIRSILKSIIGITFVLFLLYQISMSIGDFSAGSSKTFVIILFVAMVLEIIYTIFQINTAKIKIVITQTGLIISGLFTTRKISFEEFSDIFIFKSSKKQYVVFSKVEVDRSSIKTFIDKSQSPYIKIALPSNLNEIFQKECR